MNAKSYSDFAEFVNKHNSQKNYADPHNIIIVYTGASGFTNGDYFNMGFNQISPTTYARSLISLKSGTAYKGFAPGNVVWGYQSSYTGYSFKVQGSIQIK